jgi:ATP-dependent DNA ligase
MAEQLSLRLDPALPRLPASLRPMLAVATAEPFDSPEFLFEPTWGGRRVFAFVDVARTGEDAGDRRATTAIRVVDEHGLDYVARAPELADLLRNVSATSAVIDGELVVVDRTGRVDTLALGNRLRGQPGAPLVFHAIDLVNLDGRPLFATPLTRRREMLGRVLRGGDNALAVPGIVGEGRALHAAASAAGIAGVTARLRRSPYLPGQRSRMWRFIARTTAGDAGPDDGAPPADDLLPGPEGGGRAPMLALIRTLPLDAD